MQKEAKKLQDFNGLLSQRVPSMPSLGKIVEVTKSKQVKIDFVGNNCGPLIARVTSAILPYSESVNIIGSSVLLLFENGNLQLPIIIGTIHDSLECIDNSAEVLLQDKGRAEGVVDGKVLIFDANDEIILRCGKSSITLSKDGKIILKGSKLVSRASGENKIKGANVSIN